MSSTHLSRVGSPVPALMPSVLALRALAEETLGLIADAVGVIGVGAAFLAYPQREVRYSVLRVEVTHLRPPWPYQLPSSIASRSPLQYRLQLSTARSSACPLPIQLYFPVAEINKSSEPVGNKIKKRNEMK